jgi:hypothetical protein
MALRARRKSLSGDQRYLMRQSVLRVNHAVNSAYRNRVRAFVKLGHRPLRLKKLTLLEYESDAIPAFVVGTSLPRSLKLSVLESSVPPHGHAAQETQMHF